MALIRLGGLVTAISGKIGGQTLGTSASGSYIKNSGTPRKTITILQRSKMAQMSVTSQKWRELTDMQRQIIDCLDTAPLHINQIAEKTKLPIQRVGEELFSVTLSGFATQTGALWYSLGGRKPKNSEK